MPFISSFLPRLSWPLMLASFAATLTLTACPEEDPCGDAGQNCHGEIDGGGGFDGGGSDGGDVDGGGGGPPPAVFPAVTTGCTTDADGYISAGDSACFIEVTDPLLGATATLTVKATLADSGTMSFIDLIAFAETGGYEWTGYQADVGRTGTAFDAKLFDVNRTPQDSSAWTGPSGPAPITATLQVDSGATSGTFTLAGGDAPAPPLQSSAMGTARTQKVTIAVRNATVYQVIVTEP